MFPFEARDARYFYRARNAIYYLFLALTERRGRLTVLVPDYNSGNEVLAIRAAGASIVYCPVGRDMRMNPDEVERLCDIHRPDILYVIHYAGWPQPISTLVDLSKRQGEIRSVVLFRDGPEALVTNRSDSCSLVFFTASSKICLTGMVRSNDRRFKSQKLMNRLKCVCIGRFDANSSTV